MLEADCYQKTSFLALNIEYNFIGTININKIFLKIRKNNELKK